MMKKILAALFLSVLMTCAHAQGLVAPGHVIGNGTTTNPHAATDSSLSSVMDQALCGNNNSVAERVSGIWGCLSITTGVANALGIAPNSAGGIITWPLSLAGAGVSGQLPLTGIASIAADNLLGNFTGSSAAPQAGALVNCATALTYSTTTHSFSCNSGTGTGTVTGPATSTVGHVATWNNTSGTTLADSAIASLLTSGAGISISGTTNATIAVNETALTNSLSGNVNITSTDTFFDGPSVAQGSTGTWWASGTVTLSATGSDNFYCKLWDGTTIIDSAAIANVSGVTTLMGLSGYLASPAGNIKISCADHNSTNGFIASSAFSAAKASTVSVHRIQ